MTRTKRIVRTLQRLDDLAEVLLFKVLLGTRIGRQVVAITAICAAAVLYVSSGWLFNPRPVMLPESTSGAPYFQASAWTSPSDEVRDIGTTGILAPGRVAAIEAELAPRAAMLDRIVALTEAHYFLHFERTPPYKACLEIADALVARGACYAERGESFRATEQWLAAARFGRAAGWGRGDAKTFFEAMVTTAIERKAYQALQAEMKARPGVAVDVAVLRDLQRRERGELRLVADITKAEHRDLMHELHQLARGEPMTVDLSQLRGVMPVRHADRERFVADVGRELETSMARVFDARLKHWNDPTHAVEPVTLCPGCTPGHISRMHAMRAYVSRDAAVKHVALSVLPDCDAAFERMAARDHLLRDCYMRALKGLSPEHCSALVH